MALRHRIVPAPAQGHRTGSGDNLSREQAGLARQQPDGMRIEEKEVTGSIQVEPARPIQQETDPTAIGAGQDDLAPRGQELGGPLEDAGRGQQMFDDVVQTDHVECPGGVGCIEHRTVVHLQARPAARLDRPRADVDPAHLPSEASVPLQAPSGPAPHVQETVGAAGTLRVLHDPAAEGSREKPPHPGAGEALHAIHILDGEPIDESLGLPLRYGTMGRIGLGIQRADVLCCGRSLAGHEAAPGAPAIRISPLAGLQPVVACRQHDRIGPAAEHAGM